MRDLRAVELLRRDIAVVDYFVRWLSKLPNGVVGRGKVGGAGRVGCYLRGTRVVTLSSLLKRTSTSSADAHVDMGTMRWWVSR